MERETILYISGQARANDLMLSALQAGGYEVATTDSPTQAIALLFIMHSVAAVVLDPGGLEQSISNLARSLRAIRPNVPIVLFCDDHINELPLYVDACVNTEQPLEKLTSAVQRLLTSERSPVHSAQF
jgi:DNA-binding NtrC family response regulator